MWGATSFASGPKRIINLTTCTFERSFFLGVLALTSHLPEVMSFSCAF